MTFQQMGTEGCYRIKDAAFSFYETHDNNSGQFSCHYRYPSMLPHTIETIPEQQEYCKNSIKKIHLARGVCQQCQGARLNRPGDFIKVLSTTNLDTIRLF